jgi:hypothetical protein
MNHEQPTPSLQGSCHCGAVRLTLPSAPEKAKPLKPEPGARHGVNLRNFDPSLLQSVTVRHFDGADTWEFLD